jgi:hypothetical protein
MAWVKPFDIKERIFYIAVGELGNVIAVFWKLSLRQSGAAMLRLKRSNV